MTRSEAVIEEMLRKFDAEVENYPEDKEAGAIRETLLWMLGHRDNSDVEAYLED
jgi:hypothetical protein